VGEEWRLDSLQLACPGGQDELYAIILTDGKDGFEKVVALESKEEGLSAVPNFLRTAKRQWNVRVKRFHMGGGFRTDRRSSPKRHSRLRYG
jgi:hypothetical protein